MYERGDRLTGCQNPAGGSAGPTAKTGGEGKLRGKKIASRFPEGRGGPTAVLGNPGGTAAGNMGAQPPDATISENAAAGSRGAKPRREAGGGARGNWCPRETHRRCRRPESTVIFRLCREITQRQPPRRVHRGAGSHRSGTYASGRVHRGAGSHRSGAYASLMRHPWQNTVQIQLRPRVQSRGGHIFCRVPNLFAGLRKEWKGNRYPHCKSCHNDICSRFW